MKTMANTAKAGRLGSRFVVVGGAIALILFGIWLYRFLVREETLAEAALRCANYLESGDAAGLMRYIREDEKSLLELDRSKVQMLLDRFYLDRMTGFRRVGEDKLEQIVGMNGLSLTRSYRHNDGREVQLSLIMVASDSGPKFHHFVTDVLATALTTYWPIDKHLRPPAVSGAEMKYASLEQAIGTLEGLPIVGFAEAQGDGMRLIQWREALEGFKRQTEKLKAISAGTYPATERQAGAQRSGAPIFPERR